MKQDYFTCPTGTPHFIVPTVHVKFVLLAFAPEKIQVEPKIDIDPIIIIIEFSPPPGSMQTAKILSDFDHICHVQYEADKKRLWRRNQ